MKLNRIYLLQEMLVAQVNNLIFYPIALTLVMLFDSLITPSRPSLILWIICGLLQVLFYIARCHTKKLISFTAIHAAVIGGLVALFYCSNYVQISILESLNNSVNRFSFLATLIGFAAYSFYLRFHGATTSEILPMPFAVGVAAAALFLQHYQEHKEWDSYYTLPLILIIALYFLHYYIREYLNFLVVNASSTGVLPEKEIFHSGLRLAFLYTAIGALLLIATSQYTWLKTILSVLKQVIYNIIRFISSLFPKGEAEPPVIITDNAGGGQGMALPEGGEPALIWKVLEVIAIVLLIAGILYALFKGLLKVIGLLKNVMSKTVKTHDDDLTGIHDVREKCETARSKKKSTQPFELFGFLDAKERIRRIYKKKASAYKPLPLSEKEAKNKSRFNPEKLPFYTAKEMELEMQAAPFAEVYEKARYSNETCTNQDVKRMKELCR